MGALGDDDAASPPASPAPAAAAAATADAANDDSPSSDSEGYEDAPGSPVPALAQNNPSYFSKKIHIPPGAASMRYGDPQNIRERPQSGSGDGLFSAGDGTPRREALKNTRLKKKITKAVRAAIPPKATGRHRKKIRDGQLVFKGHKSWEIVLSIQFGLRYTSELLQSSDGSEPTAADFRESLAFDFNPVDDFRNGSTESHHFAKWVHPAPFVYRQVRQKFKVPEDEFLEATCSESRIRELPTPGKSGALFYITDDEKYFMKTISGVEERMLMSMLPTYYAHVNDYPNTLLTKYLAHFSVKTTRNNHIRMVVMSSVFDDQLFIDTKYDLKGSTLNRAASAKQLESENVTLKDLDLKQPIFFSAIAVNRITHQLEKDSSFLESHHVMDYSLLLGISEMLLEEDEHYKSSFGPEEENAPYEVGYQINDAGQKMGVRVCMGIIDFLQRFRTRKKAEYGMRIVQSCSCSSASVAPPSLYRQRFMDFMKTKLLPDENFDMSTLIMGSQEAGKEAVLKKVISAPGATSSTDERLSVCIKRASSLPERASATSIPEDKSADVVIELEPKANGAPAEVQ